MKIVEPSVELLWHTEEPEKIIELAGRTCYKSESKITKDSSEEFIRMILKRGHESVIEHASASFRIVTDRGITHEIVRHRLVSYSQESSRYCNYSKDQFNNEISVVQPSGIDAPHKYHAWHLAMVQAENSYFDLIDRGCPPQVARSVLPTCLKTEIVMTCNFREWMHFLKLRTNAAAHPDMIIIAKMIQKELVSISPTIFGDF